MKAKILINLFKNLATPRLLFVLKQILILINQSSWMILLFTALTKLKFVYLGKRLKVNAMRQSVE